MPQRVMAAALFSQHSSNPLEVGSSDARNRDYKRRLLAIKAHRSQPSSSDDPINGYNVEDLEEDGEYCEEEMTDGGLEETDEEMSIYLKSEEEQAEIEEEVADLTKAVPELGEHYKLVDRLGTGTFSSVYKALDSHYDEWYNEPWQGPSSSTQNRTSTSHQRTNYFVAIKRIYVTSSPERIRNEISIMVDCRGCRNISQLITAFRKADQVVVIMPYHRNGDFRSYYRTLPMIGIKAYMRCLFRALRDVHNRGIIHRDVKPANFLFDPRTGEGTLCDFGLASRMGGPAPTLGACFHTGPTPEHPHGQVSRNSFPSRDIKAAQLAAREKRNWPSEKVGYPEKDTRPAAKANRAGTRGFRAPEVLFKCTQQSGAIDVWAAGIILLFFLTGKFPLFQSNDDTEALMEIATIVGHKEMENVATLHSRTFCTNVPSVAQPMLWSTFIKQQNPSLNQSLIPNLQYYPYNLTSYQQYMRQFQEQKEQHSLPPSSSTVSSPPWFQFSNSLSPNQLEQAGSAPAKQDIVDRPAKIKHDRDISHALDFIEHVMNPWSVRRITPQQALAHPFLRGEEGDFDETADDDEFVPHPFGEGVCAQWHFTDETGTPGVKVPYVCERDECNEMHEEIVMLQPGQGLAVGRQPCEFHQDISLLSA